ncbi:glycosyltransferase [Bacillus suaedae]|uniref:Glycosyltransferase n=1 Tax=Halalkalibacter suaedae TaxID=2822140 RepID=A0A940WZB4_9BACI|nr:glycosyltransferase [Bacillus suaedae]MBP3951510.1 glycosyltransferase [Bacillus suaedae]
MKKVVVVTRRMIMGGIEKALISMLDSMPKDQYDITLLVMGMGGELINDIPSHVKVRCIFGEGHSTIDKIWRNVKRGNINYAYKIGKYKLLSKKAKSVFEQELYLSKMLPTLQTEYDIAIAYHTPASFPVVYVMDNIKAKVKAAWIHSDVTQYKTELVPYKSYYEKYDKVYCVSKYAEERFVHLYPTLTSKTKVFYNILDKEKCELQANTNSGFSDNFDGFRILTVGRLTEQKGQDIIPAILKELLSKGLNVRWYLIGEGENRQLINSIIEKNNLQEHLILLGTVHNPYPYYKKCDLYVQPSRHEGYCITLAEARIFNKPIVTTDFVGAREQIIHGKTGLIVQFNHLDLIENIVKVLTDVELAYEFQRNLANDSNNRCLNLNDLLQV